ncbi:sulfotransferase [Pseudoruegeria sp. M32A2M]|nr:sulfotransferase [Pseudoruegeria sp. M32A2M]
MLRLMLDGHSALSCSGEHDFLFDHLHRRGPDWEYDLDGLRSDRIFLAQDLDLPDVTDGAAALAQLLSQILAKGQKTCSVLMLHRGLDKAVALMPDAPIIHLLRDPRDVARSWVAMGWHGNPYCAVEGWIATEQLWSTVARDLREAPVDLRYERLLADPEGELGRCCALLGIDYEQSMLSYDASSTYHAPDPSLAEQWRRKMPLQDLRLVEARLGDLLAARGYSSSGEPPLEVTKTQDIYLNLNDFVGRWRHLIGRYGLLPVQRGFGRRLNIKSLQTSAQRRMDVITKRYLR